MDKLEMNFTTLGQQVATVAAKVDMVINELQQQRKDMRLLNERQDALQAQHNAEVKGALKYIQGLTIASMVGIAAIAVGVLGFMWSSTKDNPPPNSPAQTAQAAPMDEQTK